MSTVANMLLLIKYLEEISENNKEYSKRGFTICDNKLNQGYLEVYYLNEKYKVGIIKENDIYYWKVLNPDMEKIFMIPSQVDNSFEKVLIKIKKVKNKQ